LKKYSLYIILTLLVSILSACASVPRFYTRDERYKSESSKEKTEENIITNAVLNEKYKDADVLETTTGVASFYADKFHGKVTYNGEVYDMNGISAAHQTYPMGTVLRITNISNDKSTTLLINDRMPFREDRIIDLSLGAAKKLGIIQAGLMEVKVEVLEWGTGKK
jgi:rare lipoprotein A